MSEGYLYVLKNQHIPKLVKVGYTDRNPHTRAEELSNVTGVPGKWVVHHSWCISEAYDWEQKVFQALSAKRETGEFLRFKPDEAVDAISGLLAGWGVIGTDGLTASARTKAEQLAKAAHSKEIASMWEKVQAGYWQEAKLKGLFTGFLR